MSGELLQRTERQEDPHLCEELLYALKSRKKIKYLAKAKIIRLLVVMTLIIAKTKQTRGNLEPGVRVEAKWGKESFTTYIKRQIPPTLLLVASTRICRSGPAAEVVTVSMFPATKRRTIKKIEPVNTPMPTQVTMIFGPSMSALGTSKK